MLMSWLWTVLLFFCILCAILTGHGGALASAILNGAQSGITLALSLAGSLCLWSGVGRLMECAGITACLSRFLAPILNRLFPSARTDLQFRHALSGNICANFLGLGNAATPMGIQAAMHLVDPAHPDRATDELCRLVVLNTASIQLIPTNVAAIRAANGCATAFDILPAVWLTSFCSAGVGLLAARLLEKAGKHG